MSANNMGGRRGGIIFFKGEETSIAVHWRRDGGPREVFPAIHSLVPRVDPWPLFDYANWAAAFIQANYALAGDKLTPVRIVGCCTGNAYDRVLDNYLHDYWYVVYQRLGRHAEDAIIVDAYESWIDRRGIDVWIDKAKPLRRYLCVTKKSPQGAVPRFAAVEKRVTRNRAVLLR